MRRLSADYDIYDIRVKLENAETKSVYWESNPINERVGSFASKEAVESVEGQQLGLQRIEESSLLDLQRRDQWKIRLCSAFEYSCH